MRAQSQEELGHAIKLFEHITDRQGRVELLALSEPKREWTSPLQAFREASTSKVAQMLERIGSSGSGLVMLDRQLGKREA